MLQLEKEILSEEKMELIKRGDNLVLKEAECFDLGLSLDCGQAFRWKRNEDGVWHGVVGNLPLDVEQKDGEIVFHNTSREDFEKSGKTISICPAITKP